MHVLSRIQLFETPWAVAHQVLLSIEFSRQEYCNGLPFPTLGHLLDPGIEPMSRVSPALIDGFFTTVPPGMQISFFFFKIFFLMWTIFKVFVECVTILFLFYILVFWPGGMCDLSYLPNQGLNPSLLHW